MDKNEKHNKVLVFKSFTELAKWINNNDKGKNIMIEVKLTDKEGGTGNG